MPLKVSTSVKTLAAASSLAAMKTLNQPVVFKNSESIKMEAKEAFNRGRKLFDSKKRNIGSESKSKDEKIIDAFFEFSEACSKDPSKQIIVIVQRFQKHLVTEVDAICICKTTNALCLTLAPQSEQSHAKK